jgi:putative transposase
VIYTTNSIEALHRQLRKIIKTRGHFPTEDAARKLIYLAITNRSSAVRRHLRGFARVFSLQIGGSTGR